MGKYAIISAGKVINIAVAGKPIAENWIHLGSLPVHIGDSFDGKDFYRDGDKVKTEEEILHEQLTEMETALKILLGEVSV